MISGTAVALAAGLATVPPQTEANARWWALRWYQNATAAEREAMR